MLFWIGYKKFWVTLFSSQLRYFSPQLRYFSLFPLSYTISPLPPPTPRYTISSFSPPVKLLNSVAAKIVKDIYYKKQPHELSYFHNYAILK